MIPAILKNPLLKVNSLEKRGKPGVKQRNICFSVRITIDCYGVITGLLRFGYNLAFFREERYSGKTLLTQNTFYNFLSSHQKPTMGHLSYSSLEQRNLKVDSVGTIKSEDTPQIFCFAVFIRNGQSIFILLSNFKFF